MKFIIYLPLTVLCAISFFASVQITDASATCVAPNRTLALGDGESDVKTSEVIILQKILINAGFLNITNPTGYYGNKTLDAVKLLQKSYGLSMTGIFDSATLSKVTSACGGGASGNVSGSPTLPSFPWTLYGKTYTSLAQVASAYPYTCVIINGVEVQSGFGPCAGGSAPANGSSTNSPEVQQGVCGSADGSTLSSKPTSGLCSVGSATTITGSGPWAWTCYGLRGSSSCSANKTGSGSGLPVISAISPSSGNVGSPVTLTGTGFSSSGNTITFSQNGIEVFTVQNQIASNGKITFSVPSYYNPICPANMACIAVMQNVSSGNYSVTVTNGNGVTSNSVGFNINSIPVGSATVSGWLSSGSVSDDQRVVINDDNTGGKLQLTYSSANVEELSVHVYREGYAQAYHEDETAQENIDNAVLDIPLSNIKVGKNIIVIFGCPKGVSTTSSKCVKSEPIKFDLTRRDRRDGSNTSVGVGGSTVTCEGGSSFSESTVIVTATSTGTVYGSGPFTTDSDLAKIAKFLGATGKAVLRVKDAKCLSDYKGAVANKVRTYSFEDMYRGMNVTCLGGCESKLDFIHASDCSILAGKSSCESSVSWYFAWKTKTEMRPKIYRGTIFNKQSEIHGPGDMIVTKVPVTYGANPADNQFTLVWETTSGKLEIEHVIPKASCISGTKWDGAKCTSSTSVTGNPTVFATVSGTASGDGLTWTNKAKAGTHIQLAYSSTNVDSLSYQIFNGTGSLSNSNLAVGTSYVQYFNLQKNVIGAVFNIPLQNLKVGTYRVVVTGCPKGASASECIATQPIAFEVIASDTVSIDNNDSQIQSTPYWCPGVPVYATSKQVQAGNEGQVYGKGPFTNDSNLRTIAKFLGAKDGKEVTLKITDAGCQSDYSKGTAHGVSTNSWTSAYRGMNVSCTKGCE